jgi:hypothetical protein
MRARNSFGHPLEDRPGPLALEKQDDTTRFSDGESFRGAVCSHGITRRKQVSDHFWRDLTNADAEITQMGDGSGIAGVMVEAQKASMLAQELNQPLSAIMMNADAALRWLAGPEPNIEEARAALRRIASDCHWTSKMSASISNAIDVTMLRQAVDTHNGLANESHPKMRAVTGRVTHFEIYGEEPAKLSEFYSGLFGWQVERAPGIDYWRIQTGPRNGGGFDGGMTYRPSDGPGGWLH